MTNKQTSDLGKITRPQAPGRVSPDVPAYAVDASGGFFALAGKANALSNQLGGMAAQAAVREETEAGMSAAQNANQSYLENRELEQAGTARLIGREGVDLDNVTVGARTKLAQVQSLFGRTLEVTSGFRDPEYNARVGGAQNSRHLHGDALDISTAGMSREEVQKLIGITSAQGFTGIGVYESALHVDMAGRRAWGPSYKSDSVPEWAGEAIAAHMSGSNVPVVDDSAPQGELNTLPLGLRNDGTIRGNAFDDAAIRAYSWRLRAGLSNDIGEAFNKFQDDPVAYEQAVGEIKARYLEDGNLGDPRLREVFEQQFEQAVFADRLKISADQEKMAREGEIAAAGEGLDAQFAQIERHAFNLGANGEADTLLAPELETVVSGIRNAEQSGLISPENAATLTRQLGDRIARARIEGTYSDLSTPRAQEAFAKDLMEQWSVGAGPVARLEYSQAMALSTTLVNRARQSSNQLDAENRIAAGKMESLLSDDTASLVLTGQGVLVDGRPIEPSEVERLLGEDGLANWQAAREDAQEIYAATNGMDMQSGAEILQRVEMLRPQPGGQGFEFDNQVYEIAQKRAREVLEERARDPLGQAMRAGAVELEALDFSSADGLVQSLEARRLDAEAVAGMYGTPASYFSPSERTALASAMMENPDLLPVFAMNVGETFGDAAPDVLSELNEAGPALAHAAALANITGDLSVATDISRVLAAQQDGSAKISMPGDTKFAEVAASTLLGALDTAPATRAAMIQVAQLLFARQAQLYGFDTGEVNKPGTAANDAFVNALNRAAGMRKINGEQYGGIATVNGTKAIVPPTMPAARIENLITRLRPGDLEGQMAIGAGEFEIPLSQLRRSRLVAVGDGQYRMALGDPRSPDPRFVPGAGPDGFFVLDIYKLAETAGQRVNEPFGLFYNGVGIAGGN